MTVKAGYIRKNPSVRLYAYQVWTGSPGDYPWNHLIGLRLTLRGAKRLLHRELNPAKSPAHEDMPVVY